LNKITDLKIASKGGNQKKKFCKGGILKEFFAGGNDLFILNNKA
jgi:hypothetical protein